MSEDLLQDLVLYKTYKEKSVMMAARSLITLYREQLPGLLRKKDRGRPTEAMAEKVERKYGEVIAFDHIPGAEVLLKEVPEIDMEGEESEDDESDDDWVDIDHDDGAGGVEVDESGDEDGSDEEDDDEDGSDEEDDDEDGDDGDDDEDEKDVDNEKENDEKSDVEETTKSDVPVLDAKQAAQELILTKFLTDDDFKRIDAAKIKKEVTHSRKRPLETERSDFVKLDDIEMIHKKRKHDKQARIESVEAGRVDREKFGWRDKRLNIHCSKTNREKSKTKNFQMMRHKAHSKVKKSFKDKQIKLRNHLLKQKKMK